MYRQILTKLAIVKFYEYPTSVSRVVLYADMTTWLSWHIFKIFRGERVGRPNKDDIITQTSKSQVPKIRTKVSLLKVGLQCSQVNENTCGFYLLNYSEKSVKKGNGICCARLVIIKSVLLLWNKSCTWGKCIFIEFVWHCHHKITICGTIQS
jgi:hypothetical protein